MNKYYYLHFDGIKLFEPYDEEHLEFAINLLKNSKCVREGKVVDNTGEVVFSIDKTNEEKNKVISLEDFKRRKSGSV